MDSNALCFVMERQLALALVTLPRTDTRFYLTYIKGVIGHDIIMIYN